MMHCNKGMITMEVQILDAATFVSMALSPAVPCDYESHSYVCIFLVPNVDYTTWAWSSYSMTLPVSGR